MVSYPAQIGVMVPPSEPVPAPSFTPISIAGSGRLSQAMRQLRDQGLLLLALNDLPTELQKKRNSVLTALEMILKLIDATQTEISRFVADTLPELQRTQTDLNAGTNLSQVAQTIILITTKARALKYKIDELSAGITTVKQQVVDFSTSSAPYETQFQQQQAVLRAEMQRVASELYNSDGWTNFWNQVTGHNRELMEQLDRLNAYLVSFGTYKQAIDSLLNDLLGMMNQTDFLNNAVGFLAGDDANVIRDLANTQGNQTTAKLYLATAIRQFQTLQADAT